MTLTKTRIRAAVLAVRRAGRGARRRAGRVHGAGRRPRGVEPRRRRSESTLRHLQNLIRLNTAEPAGQRDPDRALLRLGARARPGRRDARPARAGDTLRANFVARLRATRPTAAAGAGDGAHGRRRRRHHEVGDAPFVPTIKDGYLYGRGAIDDKGMLAATVAAHAAARAAARPAGRATSSSSARRARRAGRPSASTGCIEHHRDLIEDAEFALNEGGRVRVANGRCAP